MPELDMMNRDPNGINDLIKVQFEDVLGEPEGVRSIDCVWKLSHSCFNCWLNLCYKLSTLCCGICIAAEWGCEFAYIAFAHIWILTPCMKALDINCTVFRRIYNMFTECLVTPCCEACGNIFSAFQSHI